MNIEITLGGPGASHSCEPNVGPGRRRGEGSTLCGFRPSENIVNQMSVSVIRVHTVLRWCTTKMKNTDFTFYVIK